MQECQIKLNFLLNNAKYYFLYCERENGADKNKSR